MTNEKVEVVELPHVQEGMWRVCGEAEGTTVPGTTVPKMKAQGSDVPQFMCEEVSPGWPPDHNPSLHCDGTAEKRHASVPPHLNTMFEQSSEHLNNDEKCKLAQLLTTYSMCFSVDEDDLGRTHLAEHEIDTGTAPPTRLPPRRVPLAFQGEDKEAIERMLRRGTIRPSSSSWATPINLVRKKDGRVRVTADYRLTVNSKTRHDAYPLPRIDECLDALSGAEFLCVADITSAYDQVPIAQCDIPKTAIITKWGLYEYLSLPQGLTNASSTFSRLMNICLSGLVWEICLVYIDDVIVFGKDFESTLTNLEQVLQRIMFAGLKLSPNKCKFFQKSVTFLGHVVSKEGVKPDPANLTKLKNWPRPKNVKDVRGLVGLGSYYRKLISGFSEIVQPLVNLTQKDVNFVWSKECEFAMETLKTKLTSPTIMGFPKNEGLFTLDTDASDFCIGAVLSQKQGDQEVVISYGSRTMSSSERNYCVTEKELLSIRYFIEYYSHYLKGRHFEVRSDHQALNC